MFWNELFKVQDGFHQGDEVQRSNLFFDIIHVTSIHTPGTIKTFTWYKAIPAKAPLFKQFYRKLFNCWLSNVKWSGSGITKTWYIRSWSQASHMFSKMLVRELQTSNFFFFFFFFTKFAWCCKTHLLGTVFSTVFLEPLNQLNPCFSN